MSPAVTAAASTTRAHGLRSALDALQGRRVVVLGDLIADQYVFGRPERVSREAPVLIVRHDSEALVAGGAANAARNVVALGGRATLLGVVGADALGARLRELLLEIGCGMGGLVEDPARPTTSKTRVLAAEPGHRHQHVLRLDRYARAAVGAATQRRLAAALAVALADADLLLISDYGYGVLSPGLARTAVRLARSRGCSVLVDSQADLGQYRGAGAFTPNLSEAERAAGRPMQQQAELERQGERLRSRLQAELLLITRGAEGMSLFQSGHAPWHLPAGSDPEIVDVAGAGDTVAAAFGMAISAGVPPRTAAALADLAAGVVVQRTGAATVSAAELRLLMSPDRP